jgi:hypothetical protein
MRKCPGYLVDPFTEGELYRSFAHGVRARVGYKRIALPKVNGCVHVHSETPDTGKNIISGGQSLECA